MSSDKEKKYLENIVPTVDDSVQYDKKVKSKNLTGFEEENGENIFGKNTFVYEYTPENPYLVFKCTKGNKKMSSVNIAIRLKNTEKYVGYGLNLEADKEYKLINDFAGEELEILVTANDDVKSNVFMEFGSSFSKVAEEVEQQFFDNNYRTEIMSSTDNSSRTLTYLTEDDVPKNINGNQGMIISTEAYPGLTGSIIAYYLDSDNNDMVTINLSFTASGYTMALYNLELGSLGQSTPSTTTIASNHVVKISTNSDSQGRAKVRHSSK